MATIENTIDTIMAMNVVGVKTSKPSPPSVVSTAQLPYLYIRNVETSVDELTMTFSGGTQSVNLEIIILVAASRQSSIEELYKQTRALMDALHASLEANYSTLGLESFTIREDFESVDTSSYFIVSCNMRCV